MLKNKIFEFVNSVAPDEVANDSLVSFCLYSRYNVSSIFGSSRVNLINEQKSKTKSFILTPKSLKDRLR